MTENKNTTENTNTTANSALQELKSHSESYWRMVWRRLRRNYRGMIGLTFVLLMAFVAFFSPLLASNQPIVCRYQGKLYFPAIVEILQARDTTEHWINKSRPFNLPQFNAKKELDPKDFAIWPLIPYHEYEQTLNFLAPPSAKHWFGTTISAATSPPE